MKRISAQLLTGNTILFMVALLTWSISVKADVPFPGKLPVTVTSIEAANIIHVSLETWPGFRRNVRIILPGLVLPGQGKNAKACELELAEKAYNFTVNFLSEAQKVSVKDMIMENSASPEAFSSIYTEHGTLDKALQRERLARPADPATNEPWC